MEQYWPFIVIVGSFIGFALGVVFSRRSIGDLRNNLGQQEALTEKYISESREARENLARTEAERDASKDQLRQVEAERQSVKEAVQAFSAEQLEKNRKQFLDHAEQRLGVSEEKHVSELEKRHDSIEKQFVLFKDQMERFQDQHQKIEKSRTEAFTSLNEHVKQLSDQTLKVGEEARSLSTALKGSSQKRGKWGEMALENICEMAGMTEHCDFVRQDQDSGDKRPDLVVRVPGEGKIPIDAKVPYSDYERAIESNDPEERDRCFVAHGKTVRTTMIELAKRDYPGQLGGRVDFTVMFIPIESVAAAAFAAQPDLQEEAIKKKILITTPVTLIALLKTVAIYWQQEKLAENAQKIWEESSQLHDRLKKFCEHMGKVGINLNRAVKTYNDAVGSFEGRVIPKARTIENLTAKAGSDQLDSLKSLDGMARSMSPELVDPTSIDSEMIDHVPSEED
ncbi:MAG: DNA recombination protein RmuC [Proteobacteria bacterium]|nr:DNA recombination protein RmuC [Pseudomonadota bacterium]